jgi:hypothetical protein
MLARKSGGRSLGASAAKLGLGGAVTATAGQSQSKLAQRLSPPLKKKIPTWAWFTILIYVGMVLVPYFWYVNRKWNTEKWPALYQEWAASWYCNKCGTAFKPE